MLSLLTLNTWKCEGRYGDRLERMAGELARLRPDILLLQEAFAAPDAGLDTAGHVAGALGYDRAVATARAKVRRFAGRRVDSSSNLAILTRGTITDSRTVALPSDPADGERISQIAEIAIDGARLLVVNVHLTYLPGQDETRRAELAKTLAALPDFARFDAVVMGGDFNCPPDSAPLRWLMADSGLRVTDPCRALGREFVTHEAQPDLGRPAQRIDHLFLLETAAAPSRYAIADVARVLDSPDPRLGITPSDHYGVRVRLERCA